MRYHGLHPSSSLFSRDRGARRLSVWGSISETVRQRHLHKNLCLVQCQVAQPNPPHLCPTLQSLANSAKGLLSPFLSEDCVSCVFVMEVKGFNRSSLGVFRVAQTLHAQYLHFPSNHVCLAFPLY